MTNDNASNLFSTLLARGLHLEAVANKIGTYRLCNRVGALIVEGTASVCIEAARRCPTEAEVADAFRRAGGSSR